MKLQDIVDKNSVIDLNTLKADQELVKEIQTKLKGLGLYSGDVDGLYGPRTETALAEFCELVQINNMRTMLFGQTFAEGLINPPKETFDRISLSASVGSNGANRPEDVRAVKKRLVRLGFNWLAPNSALDSTTIQTIKLFQSIISGRSTVGGDGRIDVPGSTLKWLQASNAPRWQEMPIEGEGYVNSERKFQPRDNHDFGTNWMANTIIAAGKAYQANFRATHSNAAPLVINDVSLPRGGDTTDHAGHETGLACDFMLPHKNGKFGGIRFDNSLYDPEAMRAMLKAIRQQPLFSKLFFNDPQLIKEGLCGHAGGHDDHGHFELKPSQPA